MSTLVVLISDPPVFDKKSAEVSYLINVLEILQMELGRGRGTVTAGTIIGQSATGVANTSLGSWTYVPSASKA